MRRLLPLLLALLMLCAPAWGAIATPTWEAVSAVSCAGACTDTITVPSGTDYLLVAVSFRAGGADGATTVVCEIEGTALEFISRSSNQSTQIRYYFADAADLVAIGTGSGTLTCNNVAFDSGLRSMAGWAIYSSGVNQVTAEATDGSSGTGTAGDDALTVTANALIITLAGHDADSGTVTYTGYTQITPEQDNVDARYVEAAYRFEPSPSNPETVNLSWANSVASRWASLSLAPDVTAPTPGASGALTVNGATSDTLDVACTVATDVAAQALLQYEFRRSSTNNMGSVANAEVNGTIVRAYTANDCTHTDTGLSPGTTYWYQVIVKDLAGNKAIYVQEDGATLTALIAAMPVVECSGCRGLFDVQAQTLPDGEEGEVYAGAQFAALNGNQPFTWDISAGALPSGLSLSSAGALTGAPDVGEDGTYNFTVRATDEDGGIATREFSLTVTGTPDPVLPAWVFTGSASCTRTHYVAVGGSGNGNIGTPESITTARDHVTAGDCHILRAGTYDTYTLYGSNNELNITRDCTASNPCWWMSFVDSTGQPENAYIYGGIRCSGKYAITVGLHLQGREDEGYDFRDEGCIIVNSVVHDSLQNMNLGMWGGFPLHWAYGNILYRPGCPTAFTPADHNIYLHNNAVNGWMYIVHNISMETGCNLDSRRLLQAYDQSGSTGLNQIHVEGNFFGDSVPGAAGVGGSVIWHNPTGAGSQAVVLKDNVNVDYYHNSSVPASWWLGLTNPFQATITGNYFAKANVWLDGYWGNSGSHDPFIFTGNEIYNPPFGDHLVLITRGASGAIGSHKIPDADEWDNNIYGGTFNARTLRCNGTLLSDRTLAQWRAETDNCRVTPDGGGNANGFDLNSTNPANPTTNKIVVIPNDWQCPSGCPLANQARGNIYIVNWENAASDVVNISSVVGPGKAYVVRYARDFYGTAAASGTCPGSGACNVTLNLRRSSGEATTKFANAYVITGEP